jgi:hypothetical protein
MYPTGISPDKAVAVNFLDIFRASFKINRGRVLSRSTPLRRPPSMFIGVRALGGGPPREPPAKS